MDEGAVGMSSGLTYTPGMYATTEELAQLCSTVAEYGGFYAPHHRSYGKGALEAYDEMIELSRETGCALHLSHATMNFAPNKGRAPELLAARLTGPGRRRGHHLGHVPVPARCHHLVGHPAQLGLGRRHLPTMARLRDRRRLVRDPRKRGDLRLRRLPRRGGRVGDAGNFRRSETPSWTAMSGKTMAQIAQETGQDPFDVFVDILLRDEMGTGILQHVGHEENVQAIMVHRTHTGGSDGILVGGKPHPRAWGTFPRYLGHYSRELGLLGWRRWSTTSPAAPPPGSSSRTAAWSAPGYAADLVLFDPETVNATGHLCAAAPGRQPASTTSLSTALPPSRQASPPVHSPAGPCAAPRKEQPRPREHRAG